MADTDDEWRALMRSAQAGRREDYALLLRRCEAWLRRYFARKVPPSMLDDLVQETLLSLHRKRASYDPDRAFLPWLAAIARYRWVDQLRQHYRRQEEALDSSIGLADGGFDPVTDLSLDALLGRIPDRQAEVIRLVKLAGYSVAEAAQRTGQSEALVKVNIHRGIRRMSALIEEA